MQHEIIREGFPVEVMSKLRSKTSVGVTQARREGVKGISAEGTVRHVIYSDYKLSQCIQILVIARDFEISISAVPLGSASTL